jgi:uncharacterized protein DUF3616
MSPVLAARLAPALAGLALLSQAALAQPGTIEPQPTAWRVEPALANRKEAENISAVACSPGRRTCLLVSDEISRNGHYVRFIRVEEPRLATAPGRTLDLLPSHVEETDAEAADFSDGFFYVVGSHGVSKGDGAYQPSRFFAYRFPEHAGEVGQVQRTGRLEALIASVGALAPTACTEARARRRECPPLQRDGVNIEGMVVRGGRILLGLRAPVLGDEALVLEVEAEPLFGGPPAWGAPTAHRLHRLPLGPGVGIRDMAKVEGGILVLGGPSRPEPEGEGGPAPVFFWPASGGAPRPLGLLGGVARGHKPEALLVLDDAPAGWRVLVLSDGPAGGSPTEYLLPRR